jgi:hypothetical protein
MESNVDTSTGANPSFSSFPCRDCQEQIYVDDKHISKNGKRIPLNKKDGKPHNCPKRQRYRAAGARGGNAVSCTSEAENAVTPEMIEKLLLGQKELKAEIRTTMDHVMSRLNYLQGHVQKLVSEGGR